MAEFERLGRQAWLDAMYRGDPRRADVRLHAPRKVGDAHMCRRCDGDGLILKFNARSSMDEPHTCPDCGGEGLDPNVQHGGK